MLKHMEMKKDNFGNGLSVLFAILPFLIYGAERLIGMLPSEEAWYSSDANHGPWRWGWESLFVYYPTIILLILNIFFLLKPSRNKRLIVISIQLVSLAFQLYFLTWTID